jgi:hypothetical protein
VCSSDLAVSLTYAAVVCRHAQAAKARRKVQEADNRKLQNRIKHSKPGSITVKPERKKKIIAQVE